MRKSLIEMLQQDDRILLSHDPEPIRTKDVKTVGDCLIGILMSLFKERGLLFKL